MGHGAPRFGQHAGNRIGTLDLAPVRAILRRLRRKLGDAADNPTYIFNKRRVGYWMEKGETE